MTKKVGKKIGLDLSKFNQNSYGILKEKDPIVAQKVPDKNVVTKNKVEKEESKKLGRPMIGDEPLIKKLGVALTEKEYAKIENDAGLIAVSAYIRSCMKKAGII